ncbi:MAG: AAA family ATPase [archaeon]
MRRINVVLIYGPPAAGKLTVARELAKISNFKVFHNHLANDIIDEFLEFDKGNYWDYPKKIKYVVFELAVREKINIIVTSCYAKGEDDIHVKQFIKFFQKHKAKVYFVQLSCDKDVLFKRVKRDSRKEFNKARHISKVKKSMKIWDLCSPIPFVDSFVIDNTKLSARKAAEMIKRHYQLK